MVSTNKFTKAKQYIRTNARPLDIALFEYEFNGGSPQRVLDILKTYQNDDGGFGKALESDLRMKDSSILATTVALQYVNNLNLSKINKMVERAILYLVKEKQQYTEGFPLKNFWYSHSIEQSQSPHAPWWHIDKVKPPEIEDWPNPSVEVISYLLKYPQFVPKSLIEELLDDLQTFLKLESQLIGFVYYKFLCFKRLVPYVSEELQRMIFAMIDKTIKNTDLLDEQKFEDVKIQWFVTEKSSYLFEKYHDKIYKLFENEINRMGDDGGSHPNWKWGEERLWKQVEREWTGKCTNGLLIALKHSDLLELLT
ncbi:MAG: hypothetical protein ACXABG_03195 [Promethearchaeota archaeon]|jgi:hypothetical protein